MEDTEFMSAREKERVLRQWETFLKSGCTREKFTKPLYHHLTQHCSFIAHYNLGGFFGTYFEEGDSTVRFLSQFDDSDGTPRSIEYGGGRWYTQHEYNDINAAMCQVAGKYIPVLVATARKKQRDKDVSRADALLAKHGLSRREA